MHPTTAIEMVLILVVTGLLTVVALFLRKSLKVLILTTAGFILVSSMIFYSLRPLIVESQTNNAIQQLDAHLTTTFKDDSWEISHTDDHEIKKVKFLHVIFDNEPTVVYKYQITESTIKQVRFWGAETGDNAEILFGKGIAPQHIEQK
ncbi:hypothetical protein KQ939_00515 [Planococcus sp. CP5-4]|uniref:hypothetical protein n=1 Tax=unclassified Planococcus (in: firmicutes) TaxID=2662419 RepID=UPI001C220464|nr:MULTISPECIES: hypothetical protein [unclassified Planococcus (in: firmicutes)]MBU9673349.1 hypothetical protein [Planococcus sp. CP5-4_YE]MBV0908122.1 hypothetical protein [Planococcus sp. CP5-4_UN]MBW6062183.1 hypothetical protein [Planococcus sp. CP5-4]